MGRVQQALRRWRLTDQGDQVRTGCSRWNTFDRRRFPMRRKAWSEGPNRTGMQRTRRLSTVASRTMETGIFFIIPVISIPYLSQGRENSKRVNGHAEIIIFFFLSSKGPFIQGRSVSTHIRMRRRRRYRDRIYLSMGADICLFSATISAERANRRGR